MVDSILINFLLELRTSVITLRIQLILSLQDLTDVENELLLDCIRIFANSQSLRHQLVLGKLNAQATTKLDCIWDILQRLLFGRSRSENQLAEFVIVGKHSIDRMHQVLLILI